MSERIPARPARPPQEIELLSFKSRILSIASYLGLAPFLWFFESAYDDDNFVKHHLSYSLAFGFLGLCLLAIQAAAWVIIYRLFAGDIIIDNQIDPANRFSSSLNTVDGVLVVVSLVLSLVNSISFMGALTGRELHIPLIGGLAKSKPVLQFTVVASLTLLVLSTVALGAVFHSMHLASQTPERADVYVLYTQGGYIPSPGLYESFTPPGWMVTLAFYPVVLAGVDKFGSDHVAVLPLSVETFRRAVQNGKFVFIASHGGRTPGSLTFSFQPYVEYRPENVPIGMAGDQLQFIYFAGCDAGRLENAWHRALGYDQAIMFDRISLVGEHLVWVWTKSPAVIYGLQ